MRFKDVFSIIGPAMVGPSSSHTAGAVRIGRVARKLCGALPAQADITLYGSFADTYEGHGTDLALAGGLLDMDTDDPRIPRSLELAEESGLAIRFKTAHTTVGHPNTAKLSLKGESVKLDLQGASIGGGSIEIVSVDGFDVSFSAVYPTLIVCHQDEPGVIADLTDALRKEGVNIGSMDLDRKARSGEAMTVLELDSKVTVPLTERLLALPHVRKVSVVDLAEGENSL